MAVFINILLTIHTNHDLRSQRCWSKSVIMAIQGLKQEDHKFKACLGCRASPVPAWGT